MMTGGLPAALLCATLGLALSFADQKAQIMAILSLIVSAVVAWILAPQLLLVGSYAPFMACWAIVIIAGCVVFIAREISVGTALALATGTGACTGAVVALAGRPVDLVQAIVLVMLMLPGTWLIAKGNQIVLKVFGSWLTAIAILSAAVMFAPTAGYQPDHME